MNDLVNVNMSSKDGQKKTKSSQKRKGKLQNESSNTTPTMYISPVPPSSNSSILETSAPDVSLIQPTFYSTPSNLNASFQRPKYRNPQPTAFLTGILSFCSPNTSTCFGWWRSLQEGNDLCFITKSRWQLGRDDTGIMQYTTDLKNVYFHHSEDCVRSLSPSFVKCYSPLYQAHRELLSPEQISSLFQLAIYI